MTKKKHSKRERKYHDRSALTEEEQTQLQMLMDRLLAKDPEAENFSQFLESLEPLVQRSAPFTLAFIKALGATANPVAVKALHVLQEIPAKKPVRRALKTALYRLARQGLVGEREETESEVRVLVPSSADRQAEAWASWPESLGERGLVLKLPDAGRGYLMAVGVLNPEGVFHSFEAIQTSRKGVRDLFHRITGGIPRRLIEIPVEHLRFLLEEVAETHRQQNEELPSGYEVIHSHLASRVETASGPHIYSLVGREEVAGDTLLLRSSDSLLEVQPFISWRLPEEVSNPYAEKIKALGESRLVISQSAQLERAQQIYREAAAEIFTPDLRRRYRRILEETALLLHLENRQQESKRALAVAIDLENEVGLLSENSFVLGLVKRSIAMEVGPEQAEGAGVQDNWEKITESGLIIPR